jgi:hypothetical protein
LVFCHLHPLQSPLPELKISTTTKLFADVSNAGGSPEMSPLKMRKAKGAYWTLENSVLLSRARAGAEAKELMGEL